MPPTADAHADVGKKNPRLPREITSIPQPPLSIKLGASYGSKAKLYERHPARQMTRPGHTNLEQSAQCSTPHRDNSITRAKSYDQQQRQRPPLGSCRMKRFCPIQPAAKPPQHTMSRHLPRPSRTITLTRHSLSRQQHEHSHADGQHRSRAGQATRNREVNVWSSEHDKINTP